MSAIFLMYSLSLWPSGSSHSFRDFLAGGLSPLSVGSVFAEACAVPSRCCEAKSSNWTDLPPPALVEARFNCGGSGMPKSKSSTSSSKSSISSYSNSPTSVTSLAFFPGDCFIFCCGWWTGWCWLFGGFFAWLAVVSAVPGAGPVAATAA